MLCKRRLCEIWWFPVDNSSLSDGEISWPISSCWWVWVAAATSVRRTSSTASRLDDARWDDAHVTENDGRRWCSYWRHGRHVASSADHCPPTRWQSTLEFCSFSVSANNIVRFAVLLKLTSYIVEIVQQTTLSKNVHNFTFNISVKNQSNLIFLMHKISSKLCRSAHFPPY